MIDTHNHTTFSYDGSNTPEELIEHAISVGIDTIGITDHQFSLDGRFWEYVERMNKCREMYKNKIRVLVGLEIGTRPVPNDFYASNLHSKLDFCIFECLDRGGMDLFEFFEWRRTFECTVGLAHTDIFALSEKYGLNVPRELAKRDIFWELNSSGNYPYYYDFLTNPHKRRTVKAAGLKMSPGSDTHYIHEFRYEPLKRANDIIRELGIEMAF